MLTLAIQYMVENVAGGRTGPGGDRSVSAVDDAAVRRRDLHGAQAGAKLDLLEFSRKSARIYRAEQLKDLEIRNPERHAERLMNALQKELRLDRPPRHIECFDNSNLQGAHPVASCVVFRDGKPARKEYRHFNIKTVEGPGRLCLDA